MSISGSISGSCDDPDIGRPATQASFARLYLGENILTSFFNVKADILIE